MVKLAKLVNFVNRIMSILKYNLKTFPNLSLYLLTFNVEKTFDKLSLKEFLNVCSCYSPCSLLVKVNRMLRSCTMANKMPVYPNKQTEDGQVGKQLLLLSFLKAGFQIIPKMCNVDKMRTVEKT